MVSSRGMIYMFSKTGDQYLSLYIWKEESLVEIQNILANELNDYNMNDYNEEGNKLLSISINY